MRDHARRNAWILGGALLLAPFIARIVAAGPPQQDTATEPPPQWAYGFTIPLGATTAAPTAPAPGGRAPEDTSQKHLAGSNLSFTLAQIRDPFGPADWYPGDHPTVPDIVAHGRKPDIRACGLCHYPNGKGRAENAGVADLPVSYFIQTMHDFRDGLRHSADSRKANTNMMIGFAKSMTDDEIRAAAEYFGAMPWTPWIRVVETDTVPKTRSEGGMFQALDGSDKEPLGDRVIEVPENTEATAQLRDPHSGFIAYAPIGSVKKGEALVTTGAGKTTPCAVCHGENLVGLGPVPGIARRSPDYIGRQLYDMRVGARNGQWTQLMKPVVAKLTNDDIVAITAYLASRPVSATALTNSGSTSTSGAEPEPAAAGADSPVAKGAALYKSYGCFGCHGVKGEGTDDAPDLTGTKKDAAQIAAFLQKPDSDARVKGMPNVPADSSDLQPLVAFVLSLKKQ